jgi:hypothetical protein
MELQSEGVFAQHHSSLSGDICRQAVQPLSELLVGPLEFVVFLQNATKSVNIVPLIIMDGCGQGKNRWRQKTLGRAACCCFNVQILEINRLYILERLLSTAASSLLAP